jgi:hypothetical protein
MKNFKSSPPEPTAVRQLRAAGRGVQLPGPVATTHKKGDDLGIAYGGLPHEWELDEIGDIC